MKTVVSVNEISEFEIKPRNELAQWKTSVEAEIRSRWPSVEDWARTDCPVCSEPASSTAFEKSGFTYAECTRCKTLFADRRPSAAALARWYRESASTAFWKKQLLQSSAASRDEKIIEPRANWIVDGLSEYLPHRSFDNIHYTDISFFGAALTEKVAQFAAGIRMVAAGLTDDDSQSTSTIQKQPLDSLDDLSALGSSDVLVAIDVLERVPSLRSFIDQASKIVRMGGLLFATCPVSSGFEIQSLWDRSPSIIPPDKLNLPSVNGLIELFSASGQWKILELSTPGMFDVELVKETMAQYPADTWPRPLHALVDHISASGVNMFTEYLQSQRLSSFARIVLRRI